MGWEDSQAKGFEYCAECGTPMGERVHIINVVCRDCEEEDAEFNPQMDKCFVSKGLGYRADCGGFCNACSNCGRYNPALREP